jgi:hypothetical protein
MSDARTNDLRNVLTELVAAIDAYRADPWDSDMQTQTDRYETALRRAREALTALEGVAK